MTEPVALVFDEHTFTRADLEARAQAFAARLRERGLRPGDRVALMSGNRPEFVVALLGIWRAGGVVVLFSPTWRAAEVDHALALTEPVLAVGDQPVLAAARAMLSLDDIRLAGPAPQDPALQDATSDRADVDPDVAPDADAVLVFSSGTTGMPKAVRHTHASLAAAVEHWRTALELTPADRMQVATPPSQILGLLNLVTCLNLGIQVRLHRRFDLEQVLRSIEHDRITVEMAVAPIALALAAHPDLESFDLSSLRFIMWGATPVSAAVAQEVTRRTGVGWVPAYGASELPVIACNPVSGARLDSVGRAVPGVEVRVVDPATGAPRGPDEAGEIEVRAASRMAGYLPAEATAEALRGQWYRTGDIGTLDAEGWIRLTDRAKEMVKVRGFQVAPAEVEAVLHEHPAVTDCAVFGVPDPDDGEAVVAAVTLSYPVVPEELARLVGERLASYKKPRQVLVVPQIPRLPSGKVLRRVLKEQHGRPTVR